MLSSGPVSQFAADDDDEVFDQMVPDTVTGGRVLPPTSSSYRSSHRVSVSLASLLMLLVYHIGATRMRVDGLGQQSGIILRKIYDCISMSNASNPTTQDAEDRDAKGVEGD